MLKAWQCTDCGQGFLSESEPHPRYCPQCGSPLQGREVPPEVNLGGVPVLNEWLVRRIRCGSCHCWARTDQSGYVGHCVQCGSLVTKE